MDELQNAPAPNGPKKKKTSNVTIIAILFGIIAIAMVIWQFSTKSELNKLQNEKEEQRVALQAELDSLLSEHSKVKSAYDVASADLNEKDSIIIANAKQIKEALNYRYDYFKIKKKMSELQTIAQGYVRKLDSLYQVNEELVVENNKIRTDLNNQLSISDSLRANSEELSNVVATAKVLQTFALKADAIKVRSSGREKETTRIRRMDKFRVCFTLGANPVVEKGVKTVYMRIAMPGGEILSESMDDTHSFEYNGDVIQYSTAQDFDYAGDKLDLCLYFDKPNGEKLVPGIYPIDIFVDGHQIGQTSVELK